MKKAVLLRSCAALLVPFAAATFVATPAVAQETTSSITGTVTAKGAPVPNATVTVLHVPSGTKTTVTTNASGAYTAAGVRTGGPYTVTVTAPGYSRSQVTDVYTTLGQNFELPLTLESVGKEIVVTASRVRGARSISSGPATVLTANDISKVASVNRDIRDLMQRDPFASLDASQSTGRQVTFAGVNPRFNRFTIDGVPITDSFGLNPDALPSRRGPVPLDAIAQFETKVAPYDIREGFFEGGVINAVLKSGTNKFHGTAFYTYNDNSLNGHENRNLVVPNLKTKSQDFGAELAGPIVKDRLFFMVAGERVRATLPITYSYQSTIPDATLNQVISIAKSVYNVDAGSPIQINSDHDDRLVAKIDANISDKQRLSLTGIYTKDSIIAINRNFNNSVSTMSDDYVKPNRVFGGVAQLNSDWSSVFSTEARVRYKDYKSGQNPFTPATALAVVCTDPTQALTSGTSTSCPNSAGTVFVGPPGSAAANKLRVKTFGASLLGRLNLGAHTVRVLGEYENSNNYDLFLAGSNSTVSSPGPYGAYYFDTLYAFQNRTAQAFGYTNSTTGNQSDAAAAFTYKTYTAGIQDDWRINDQLHVGIGVRYDRLGSNSMPAFNKNFLNREGFANTFFVDGKSLLQPRIGFDYTPTRRLTFHGGIGIFGGGTPDVYVANSFSATGVQPASVSNTQVPSALNNVSLTTVPPAAQAAVANALLSANGTVSALSPNFKIPSQWRATLSGNYRANLGPLGDNWQVGGDILFNKVRNAIFVQDFRDRPITGASALTPDGRQRYFDIVCNNNTTACPGDPGDYVLTNTHRGRGFIAVAHVNKTWDFGLSAGVSFTYQNVKDQQALTSSIAASNYNNGAYLDPNGGAYGHSNDEIKYSVKYNLSYEHAWFGDYKTRIDLFGQTRSGYPFSYTFFDPNGANRSAGSVFGTTGSASRYLFYVPTGPNDPKAVYANMATQTAVESLINSTDLKKYRGMIAPRNAFHDPWFTKIDLHVEQQIPTFVRQARISLYGDVENVLNLLNHNWGETLRSNFPGNKSVVTVNCVAVGANSCDHYIYSSPSTPAQLASTPANSNLGASLYTIRVGARLSF